MYDPQVMLNAETSLAGAILIDARCLQAVPKELKGSHFLSNTCGVIYDAARELEAQGENIDPITIQRRARERKELLDFNLMKSLMDITPTCAHAGEYAQIVRENALRRDLYLAAKEVGEDLTTPLNQLMEQWHCKMSELYEQLDHTQRMKTLEEYSYEEPRWLIKPYFQRGKGTLIQADPGTGKTAFMCAVAAAVSTGEGFLGLEVQTPGDVLLLSAEDEPGILRGRIEACGGDLSRVHLMEKPYQYTLNSPEIEEAVRQKHIKLLIFDPFQAFLGPKVDLFRANETRPILTRLFDMCARHDCACVIIAHLGKQTAGKSAVNQSLGSVDIPGAMRSILHLARSAKRKDELCAVHIKSSNAPRGKTITFTIGDKGGVQFRGLVEEGLEEMTSVAPSKPQPERLPIVRVVKELAEENPEGGFWSYEALKHEGFRRVGVEVFWDSRNLRTKLDDSVLSYICQECGMLLTMGERFGGKRGIRLQPMLELDKLDEVDEMTVFTKPE